MSGALRGFLITALLWIMLAAFYSLLELAMGRMPFAMFDLSGNGKFVVFTVLLVLLIGTGVGLASDRIRATKGR